MFMALNEIIMDVAYLGFGQNNCWLID